MDTLSGPRHRLAGLAFLVALGVLMALAAPALADYLGPDRTAAVWERERLQRHYEAVYDPPGVGWYGCTLDLYDTPDTSCPSTGSVTTLFKSTGCPGWPGRREQGDVMSQPKPGGMRRPMRAAHLQRLPGCEPARTPMPPVGTTVEARLPGRCSSALQGPRRRGTWDLSGSRGPMCAARQDDYCTGRSGGERGPRVPGVFVGGVTGSRLISDPWVPAPSLARFPMDAQRKSRPHPVMTQQGACSPTWSWPSLQGLAWGCLFFFGLPSEGEGARAAHRDCLAVASVEALRLPNGHVYPILPAARRLTPVWQPRHTRLDPTAWRPS